VLWQAAQAAGLVDFVFVGVPAFLANDYYAALAIAASL